MFHKLVPFQRLKSRVLHWPLEFERVEATSSRREGVTAREEAEARAVRQVCGAFAHTLVQEGKVQMPPKEGAARQGTVEDDDDEWEDEGDWHDENCSRPGGISGRNG